MMVGKISTPGYAYDDNVQVRCMIYHNVFLQNMNGSHLRIAATSWTDGSTYPPIDSVATNEKLSQKCAK